MNKNTKMILGVGAVAIVGYLVWKQMSKPKASFANLTSSRLSESMLGCPCQKVVGTHTDTNGNVYDDCAGGQSCKRKATTVTQGAF